MARAQPIRDLRPDASFRAAAARVVAVRAGEMWSYAAGVLDTDDIDRVHDMRVASRRLRAALEIFAPCFPRRAHAEALAGVKRLADALGERRDPDVQIAALRRFAEAAGPGDRPGLDLLVERLADEQGAGNRALQQALEAAERTDLPGRLVALAAAAEGRSQ